MRHVEGAWDRFSYKLVLADARCTVIRKIFLRIFCYLFKTANVEPSYFHDPLSFVHLYIDKWYIPTSAPEKIASFPLKLKIQQSIFMTRMYEKFIVGTECRDSSDWLSMAVINILYLQRLWMAKMGGLQFWIIYIIIFIQEPVALNIFEAVNSTVHIFRSVRVENWPVHSTHRNMPTFSREISNVGQGQGHMITNMICLNPLSLSYLMELIGDFDIMRVLNHSNRSSTLDFSILGTISAGTWKRSLRFWRSWFEPQTIPKMSTHPPFYVWTWFAPISGAVFAYNGLMSFPTQLSVHPLRPVLPDEKYFTAVTIFSIIC